MIYHLGFKEYHIKVWMEFAGDFKKEWDCLEALQETGGCVVKHRKYRIRSQDCMKCGFGIFAKMHQKKTENGF